MAGRLPPVLDGIPEYKGAAVYALVDETGQRSRKVLPVNIWQRLSVVSSSLPEALSTPTMPVTWSTGGNNISHGRAGLLPHIPAK